MSRINLMPLAGSSKRYLDAGYSCPKQFIKINGIPMFIKAALSLPPAEKWFFICLKKHVKKYQIVKNIKKYFKNFQLICLPEKTRSQLETCLKIKRFIKQDDLLTIGACDGVVKYKKKNLFRKYKKTDLIVWTFKDKKVIKNNPRMYGYVKLKKKKVQKITCKKLISKSPENDNAIIGIFTFLKAKYFFDFSQLIKKKNLKVNGEFYIDTVANECLKNKMLVNIHLVDKYICWGTPKDYKRFLEENS